MDIVNGIVKNLNDLAALNAISELRRIDRDVSYALTHSTLDPNSTDQQDNAKSELQDAAHNERTLIDESESVESDVHERLKPVFRTMDTKEREQDKLIDIHFRSSNAVDSITFTEDELNHLALNDIVKRYYSHYRRGVRFIFGGNELSDQSMTTLSEYGIDEDAMLDVIPITRPSSRDEVRIILDDIDNMNGTRTYIRKTYMSQAEFNDDDELENLDLSRQELSQLPESFGNLHVGGNLNLGFNQLSSLPESFSNVRVGGDLHLSYNQLSSLPESFGTLKVGGDIDLDHNHLRSLPESVSNLAVGGSLVLNTNELSSLPESFGNLEVGGGLDLGSNQLSSLPESFGKLRVGKNLCLHYNGLLSLPDSFSNLIVGETLSLHSNPLSSLPDSLGNITLGKPLILSASQPLPPPSYVGTIWRV